MTEVKIMGAGNKYYFKILKCMMIFKMLRSNFFFFLMEGILLILLLQTYLNPSPFGYFYLHTWLIN